MSDRYVLVCGKCEVEGKVGSKNWVRARKHPGVSYCMLCPNCAGEEKVFSDLLKACKVALRWFDASLLPGDASAHTYVVPQLIAAIEQAEKD